MDGHIPGELISVTAAPAFCGGCGHRNRDGARVCARCGRQLVQICAICRQPARRQARFCNSCGAALTPGAAQAAGGSVAVSPVPSPLLNGRYCIQHLLAKGGMGSVFAVGDVQQPGRTWALKEMDLAALDPAERQDAVADFRREATLLRTLRHAHLVQVVDHFAAGDKEYLVMEYVQGEILGLFIRRAANTEAQVLPIALQICDVLDYLHRCTPPIIYRDLKPSNVMVESITGQVKLIDFGIARFYKPGKLKDTHMLGTPGFAPPEQYGNGQTDARSDIFALGVTLHVLLTDYDVEQTPWHYPPVRTLNPQVSPQLEQIVAKATAMRVDERYQTAAEMRTALLAPFEA